jgi:hypothetical protein
MTLKPGTDLAVRESGRSGAPAAIAAGVAALGLGILAARGRRQRRRRAVEQAAGADATPSAA